MNYTFRFDSVFRRSDQLLAGLYTTIELSLAAIVVGLLIGIIGALASSARAGWVRGPIRAYVELVRNTPLLAQLFWAFFGLAYMGVRLNAFVAALLVLGLNFGAYATEIIRGGIDAVPAGLKEAGLALALRPIQVFFLVVLKPAVKTMFPALAGQCTLLILSSALVGQIGLTDLFRTGAQINSETYLSFEVYIVVCAIYIVLAVTFRLACALVYWLAFREKEPHATATAVSIA